jgi:23S rRNA (adenine2503-C2)-methyltransferase
MDSKNEARGPLVYRQAFYLPSGRVFLLETNDGYPVECTEMRDVSVGGKEHYEVRNSMDPHVIWNHLKPYEDKWLLTVSTQKGCVHRCRFCDVAGLRFGGNLTQDEIEGQVRFLIRSTPYVTRSEKVKIGFARMGEPSHNLENTLNAMKNLPKISKEIGRDFDWLPCFNSILPRKTIEGRSGFEVIDEVIETKESCFNGFLHFQVSCNSTDEVRRKMLFAGADVLSIKEIIEYINEKRISNRTVTLNFIVMKGVPVEVDRLIDLGLNPERFVVKLIPLNRTQNSKSNNLDSFANYENYEDLVRLGDEFRSKGIPVVIDSIARCEEAGLCCGQLAHIFVDKKVV